MASLICAAKNRRNKISEIIAEIINPVPSLPVGVFHDDGDGNAEAEHC